MTFTCEWCGKEFNGALKEKLKTAESAAALELERSRKLTLKERLTGKRSGY